MSDTSASSKPTPSIISRVVLQQCLSARLQLNHPDDALIVEGEEEPVYATVGKGLVVYVCFLKGATADVVEKIVKSVLCAKLSEGEFGSKRVAILDLPGDILVVPQATLGGRLKGKSMQYHSNVEKSLGHSLYQNFVTRLEEEMRKRDECREKSVRWGTYGNRQILSLETNGPYTHLIEI